MNQRQYSFAELTRKSVINVADGKELGKACDLIFSSCGNVCGIVVPGKKSIIKSITSADTIYIPWNRIMKIGADAVLVELVGNYASTMSDADTQIQEQNKDISY
ncbi:MAG: YlmC/YmxH family sporulation protein [Firmicutes bacterium]|nr:YlmC/YmxH family sporulation protein [Bacillota bacterium]